MSSDADAHSEQDRLPVIPSAEDLNDLIQYITYFVDWWADIDTSLANAETTLNGSSRSRTRVTERWAKVQGKCASFHQQVSPSCSLYHRLLTPLLVYRSTRSFSPPTACRHQKYTRYRPYSRSKHCVHSIASDHIIAIAFSNITRGGTLCAGTHITNPEVDGLIISSHLAPCLMLT